MNLVNLFIIISILVLLLFAIILQITFMKSYNDCEEICDKENKLVEECMFGQDPVCKVKETEEEIIIQKEKDLKGILFISSMMLMGILIGVIMGMSKWNYIS